MKDKFHSNDGASIQELVSLYWELKNGNTSQMLDEEEFLTISDYFDDSDELSNALDSVTLGLEYFPFSSQLTIKIADILIAMQQFEKALDVLEAASLLDSRDINIFILKIDAYLGLENETEAEAIWSEVLNEFEGEELIDLLFELSDVYDDYDLFDKVFDCLKILLDLDPTNEEALYKICFWTDYTGRNEESIKLHQKILDNFPYCELAWFNLGAAYQGIKLYEKSIDAYQYAVTINENLDFAYRNMGDAYMRLRKYKEAIETLEKVLEISKAEDVIYEAIGHCYHRINQFAKARLHYRKAMHLQPNDGKLSYKIALTYMDEENWTKALAPLKTAMSLAHAPEFNLAMGECLLQLGEYNEAVIYFSLVVKQRSRNIPGWEALIRCLYIAGYYEEMIQHAEYALSSTENKPIFYFYLVMGYYATGNIQEATLYLEQGMQLAPRMFKKALELNPSILKSTKIVDVLARYKRLKK